MTTSSVGHNALSHAGNLTRAEILTRLSSLLDTWKLFDLRTALEDLMKAGGLPEGLTVDIDPMGISNPISGGRFRNLHVHHPTGGDFVIEGGTRRVEWVNAGDNEGVNAQADGSEHPRPRFNEIWGLEEDARVNYRPADQIGTRILGAFCTSLADLYRSGGQEIDLPA